MPVQIPMKDTKKLKQLQEGINDVHKSAQSPENIERQLEQVKKSNEKTLETMASGHKSILGVSIVAIVFIVVAGLALYHKFRCWEKKHIL